MVLSLQMDNISYISGVGELFQHYDCVLKKKLTANKASTDLNYKIDEQIFNVF